MQTTTTRKRWSRRRTQAANHLITSRATRPTQPSEPVPADLTAVIAGGAQQAFMEDPWTDRPQWTVRRLRLESRGDWPGAAWGSDLRVGPSRAAAKVAGDFEVGAAAYRWAVTRW